MTINNKFNIGDIVYLITDTDKLKRMVVNNSDSFARKSELKTLKHDK